MASRSASHVASDAASTSRSISTMFLNLFEEEHVDLRCVLQISAEVDAAAHQLRDGDTAGRPVPSSM
ncbi:MAG: hypothetical protein ACLUFW_10820 [Alistipes sp.]